MSFSTDQPPAQTTFDAPQSPDLETRLDGVCTRYWWASPDILVANGQPITLDQVEGARARQILEQAQPHVMRPGMVMWHLTRDARRVMLTCLKARKPMVENPRGVYMFSSRSDAEEFLTCWHEPLQLLRVDVSGLVLRRDRMVEDAWYSQDDIDAQRLEWIRHRASQPSSSSHLDLPIWAT